MRVGFAEGVVQRSIECAGRDLGAKLGNRLSQLHGMGHLGGSLQVLWLKFVVDVDGVCGTAVAGRDAADIACQVFHRFQRLIVRDYL
jgi:hypothetical protein